jgi:hypothetical protein
MTNPPQPAPSGRPPFFGVHVEHPFEGFEIARVGGLDVLLARCGCGAVLDRALAVYAGCPDCGGGRRACLRCGGTGRVVDHARLTWDAAC